MEKKESHEHPHSVLKKQSTNEDRYFAERDQELVEKHRKEKELRKREEEKKLHHMKCPKCGSDLKEIKFKGLLLDKCGECEGLWFDKGELQQLLKEEANILKSLMKGFFEDNEIKKL
jgi:hypothetical protein